MPFSTFFGENDKLNIILMTLALSICSRVVRELARFKDTLLFDEDDDSNTPLHLACTNGHYSMAKVLLNAGCDPDAK